MKTHEKFLREYLKLFIRVLELVNQIITEDNKIKKKLKTDNITPGDIAKKFLLRLLIIYFIKQKRPSPTYNSLLLEKLFLTTKYPLLIKDNIPNDLLVKIIKQIITNDTNLTTCSSQTHLTPFANFRFSLEALCERNSFNTLTPDILELIHEKIDFKDLATDKLYKKKVAPEKTKLKKSSGVYYTPTPIVKYMCRKSLYYYLTEKLAGKVSKNEIYDFIYLNAEYYEVFNADNFTKIKHKLRLPANIINNASTIDDKLKSLKVCDPAVGSGAFLLGMLNEIIRLRIILFYRSECYHQDIPIYENQNELIYNLKAECISNSLYGMDIDKEACEITKLRLQLSLLAEFKNFDTTNFSEGLKYHIKNCNTLTTILNGKSTLFSSVFSSENPGFDIVIGNPPYVKKEHLNKKIINNLEKYYKEIRNGKVKSWTDDLYIHFIFKGMEILKKNGILSYITNDSFLTLSTKKRARELLLNNTIKEIIRCPKETFDAMIYTVIFIAIKKPTKNELSPGVIKRHRSKPTESYGFNSDSQEGNGYISGELVYPNFESRISGTIPYEIINSLPNRRLISYTPIIKVYSRFLHVPKVKNYLNILDTGIHSGNVRHKIFFVKKEKDNLERLLQGRQISQYGIFWNSPDAKYKYCDISYKPENKKGKGRKGRPSKYKEYWHFCGDIENHHQPERLLMRQSDNKLTVAYHNIEEHGKFYTDNTLFTILPKDNSVPLKYAMALLNSSLMNSFYHLLSQEKNKTFAQVKIKLVRELPFIIANTDDIIRKVDEILSLTKSEDYLYNPNKQKQVKFYKKEIDKLIYKIYGLSDFEIS